MKPKDIIFLLVPMSLLVAAWIIFNIHHNSVASTISSSLSTNILPITASFDTKTMANLKERGRIQPLFEFQKAITPTPTPLPIPTSTPTKVPTPTPVINQQIATPSATITP